jgi:hypothetical protein
MTKKFSIGHKINGSNISPTRRKCLFEASDRYRWVSLSGDKYLQQKLLHIGI